MCGARRVPCRARPVPVQVTNEDANQSVSNIVDRTDVIISIRLVIVYLSVGEAYGQCRLLPLVSM